MVIAHWRAWLMSGLSMVSLAGCAQTHSGATTRAAASQASADVAPPLVQAEVKTLTIPTYPVGPATDFPDLGRPSQQRQRPGLYPYTALHDLSFDRRDQQYQAFVLENEFLRLTVLPSQGGRLFSMYDKSSKQEVVYRQVSIKPGLVALRGAWISGGIEWDFPRSHSVTTYDTVSCEFVHHEDGSASIVVGDTERSFHTAWTVEMRLRPGVAAMETHITWRNPNATPRDGYWWSNACFPADDQTQVIFPFYKTTGDNGGLSDWPMRGGRDMSWYNAYPNSSSIFRGAGDEDFFAAYDYGRDLGLAQYADHRLMPGRKWFTWGTSDAGQTWAKTLSDDNRPYIEIQSGDPLTQGMQFHMQPHEQREYLEYWMPVSRIGPPSRINPEAAVRLTVDKDVARVGVMATHRFVGHVELCLADYVVRSWDRILSPDDVLLDSVPLAGADTENLWLRVFDGTGREIIAHHFDHYAKGAPAAEPANQTDRPRDREPQVAAEVAKFNQGVNDIWQGNYDQARDALQSLAEGRPTKNVDPNAIHFYLGVAQARLDQDSQAMQNFDLINTPGLVQDAATVEAAKLLMSQGNWQAAVDRLSGPATNNNAEAGALMTLGLRQLNNTHDAALRARHVLQHDPLNAMAQAELAIMDGKDFQGLPPLRDEERRIELATAYMALKQNAIAEKLLQPADAQAASPVADYLRAYVLELMGDSAQAKGLRDQAAGESVRGSLPARLEELAAFKSAIANNDNDVNAHYLAGLVLYDRGRTEEAIAQMTAAVKLNPTDAIFYYCLGEMIRENRPAEAQKYYERAIELAPTATEIYSELDSTYLQNNDVDDAIKLLEGGLTKLPGNDRLAHWLAIAYFDAGRYDDTIKTYQANRFRVAEGQRDVHDYYSLAYVGRAIGHLKAGENKEALDDLNAASEYPENLGIGRPQSGGASALIQYWRGVALFNMNKPDEARQAWESAVPREGNLDRFNLYNPMSGLNGAYAVLSLRRLGETDDAAALWDRIDTAMRRLGRPDQVGATAYVDIVDGLLSADTHPDQTTQMLDRAAATPGPFIGYIKLSRTWADLIAHPPKPEPATEPSTQPTAMGK